MSEGLSDFSRPTQSAPPATETYVRANEAALEKVLEDQSRNQISPIVAGQGAQRSHVAQLELGDYHSELNAGAEGKACVWLRAGPAIYTPGIEHEQGFDGKQVGLVGNKLDRRPEIPIDNLLRALLRQRFGFFLGFFL